MPLIVIKYRYGHTPQAEWILSDEYEGRIYEYRGYKYRALELSLIGGITAITVQNRLRLGWSIKEIVETPMRSFNGKMIQTEEQIDLFDSQNLLYRGENYSLKEFAEFIDMPLPVVRYRFSRLCSAENIARPEGLDKHCRYEYKSRMYSATELSFINGVPSGLIALRHKKLGWPIEKAISVPVANKRSLS